MGRTVVSCGSGLAAWCLSALLRLSRVPRGPPSHSAVPFPHLFAFPLVRHPLDPFFLQYNKILAFSFLTKDKTCSEDSSYNPKGG